MLSGSQIRAGRALLGWSARTLAEQSGVSESTIRRAEAVDGTPRVRADNLLVLERAMEAAHPRETAASRRRKANSRERQVRT
jgi:ribosome-binding protein aMBF1 (putative translation factor)